MLMPNAVWKMKIKSGDLLHKSAFQLRFEANQRYCLSQGGNVLSAFINMLPFRDVLDQGNVGNRADLGQFCRDTADRHYCKSRALPFPPHDFGHCVTRQINLWKPRAVHLH